MIVVEREIMFIYDKILFLWNIILVFYFILDKEILIIIDLIDFFWCINYWLNICGDSVKYVLLIYYFIFNFIRLEYFN